MAGAGCLSSSVAYSEYGELSSLLQQKGTRESRTCARGRKLSGHCLFRRHPSSGSFQLTQPLELSERGGGSARLRTCDPWSSFARTSGFEKLHSVRFCSHHDRRFGSGAALPWITIAGLWGRFRPLRDAGRVWIWGPQECSPSTALDRAYIPGPPTAAFV